MTLVKTDDKSYMKDLESGAMVHTDNESFSRFMLQRESTRRSKTLENRMSKLENDISSIKNILEKVLENSVKTNK